MQGNEEQRSMDKLGRLMNLSELSGPLKGGTGKKVKLREE